MSVIQVYRLDVTKKQRNLEMLRTGPLGFKTSQNTGNTISFSAVKYGTASFKVTVNEPLGTGEYAIAIGDPNQPQATYGGLLFCFGID